MIGASQKWRASEKAVAKMSVSLKERQHVDLDGKTKSSVLWGGRSASRNGCFPNAMNLGITFDLDPW